MIKEITKDNLDLLLFNYDSTKNNDTNDIQTNYENTDDIIQNGEYYLSNSHNNFFCMVWLYIIKKKVLIENNIKFNEQLSIYDNRNKPF